MKNVRFYPLSFTGKERDPETGYSYFGARYYDSDLSGLFLSIDPMSDKYPSISPYSYCTWNPLRLVDPNGDSIKVIGEQSSEIVKQLQTKNMNVSTGQNGFLNVDLAGNDLSALSEEENVIYNALTSDKINMTIVAGASCITESGRHYFILKENNVEMKMETVFGGSFCGAYMNNVTGRIDTYSFIDFDYMNGLGFDQGVVHEMSENYYAGLSVLRDGKNIPYGNTKEKNDRLLSAHQRAIPERLAPGTTYSFGPRRGQFKLSRMKPLYELLYQ